MRPLDQMLSPIRDRVMTQTPNLNEIMLMERIRKQKDDLLKRRINPAEVDLVRTEIIESWIRSYNFGLNPSDYNNCPILDGPVFDRLIKEKELLIHSADPYISQLETLDANYLIMLTDEKGTILKVHIDNPHVLKQLNEVFKLTPGAVWTEQTVGTCSHVMSLLLASPIQLCGPEIYLEKCSNILSLLLGNPDQSWVADPSDEMLNQTACSSAPIFNVQGDLAGSLTIISPYLHHQNSHSLGLAVSTAWAIQNEYHLAIKADLLKATLEAFGEAVITIDRNGFITQSNMTAQRILSFLNDDLTGINIENIVQNHHMITSVMESGRPVFNADIRLEGWNQLLHLRSAQPMMDQAGNMLGCVLTFKAVERIRKPEISGISPDVRYTFDSIIGQSQEMTECIAMAQKHAHLNANILLQGESGTGKEVFAQAIHNEGRPDGPFIAINCAAIPKTLIESELFGYEGGAFTGAERQGRPGKIELANRGTLFLDEIGDMPMELQSVLLRVLEEKKVMRVGGSRYIPVDFRLVTATNKNLLELVNNKQFREDLYYRLAVFNIKIPPLRERAADIIRLAKHFISTMTRNQHMPDLVLSDDAMYCLMQYNWPGNVRQLENAMLFAVNTTTNGVIKAEDLPDVIREKASASHARQEIAPVGNDLSIKELEKITIIQALQHTGHNISETASLLGMSRSTLYRKVKDMGL